MERQASHFARACQPVSPVSPGREEGRCSLFVLSSLATGLLIAAVSRSEFQAVQIAVFYLFPLIHFSRAVRAVTLHGADLAVLAGFVVFLLLGGAGLPEARGVGTRTGSAGGGFAAPLRNFGGGGVPISRRGRRGSRLHTGARSGRCRNAPERAGARRREIRPGARNR